MTEQDAIQATREHFAQIHRQSAQDAQTGKLRVNDVPSWTNAELDAADACLAGDYDHTFTFRQHREWLMSGVFLPLLR